MPRRQHLCEVLEFMRSNKYLLRAAALLLCFTAAIAFPPARLLKLKAEPRPAKLQTMSTHETPQAARPNETLASNSYNPAGNEPADTFCMSEMIKPIDPMILVALLILLVMGATVWIIAIERGLRLAITGRRARRIAKPLLHVLQAGDLAAAAELCLRHEGATLAPVVRAGLQLAPADQRGEVAFAIDVDRAQLAWQRTHTARRVELGRGLCALATIGSTAPFVGLFGTVFGIISAFTGMKYVEVAGVAAVAGGLAEALLTTALGVGVAVPAVWVYNYFSNRAAEHLLELDSAAAQALNCLQRQQHCR
jgi:biopolymer transport protein ExbB/biopolymer transport protein TolQ